MKKIFGVMFTILVITLLTVIGVFAYKGFLLKTNKTEKANQLLANAMGEAKFEFEPVKVTEKGEYSAGDSNPTLVPMYVDDGYYYVIKIPSNVNYVTDYQTYIYSTDGTFEVKRVLGVSNSNISGSFGMSNVEQKKQGMVSTKRGLKKPQEVGVIVYDDIGFLAKTYNNSFAFSTIYDSFATGAPSKYTYSELSVGNTTETVQSPLSIPLEEGNYTSAIRFDGNNQAYSVCYAYNDGFLSVSNMLQSFQDVQSEMYRRVKVANYGAGKIDIQCVVGDGYYYCQVDDFTLLLTKITSNETTVLLGNGAEARYNIITYFRKTVTY